MTQFGGLAQLARALALQAKGHRFESDILHQNKFFKQDVTVEAVKRFKATYITTNS